MAIIEYIRDALGNTVVLPIVIFVLGLILGIGWRKALHSAMMVGIGFIALSLSINLMMSVLGPASFDMVERTGLTQFKTLDLGFAPAAAIALGTVIGASVIPFVFVLNLIMLLTRMTKTLNVDIWNYWHYALSGSMVYFITGGNFWAGILAAMTHAIYSLLIADATAPRIQEFFNLPGVSIPHGWATTSVPLIIGMNWIFDRIPVFRDIDIDMDGLKKKIGIFGEPYIIGAIMGIIIGIVAGWDFGQVAQLAMTLAASMYLFPRMVAILIEGLSALSKGGQEFFKKKLKGREAYVGLDSALLMGYSGTVIAGVILIPITILIAAVLPGNTTLPFGDLAWIAFFIPMCAPLMKGNMFRTLVSGVFIVAMVLLISTVFGPAITAFGAQAGYEIPSEAAGFQYITGMSAGNLVSLILYKIADLGAVVSTGIVFVISLGIAAVVGFRRVRSEREMELQAQET